MFNRITKKLNGHALEPAAVRAAMDQVGRDLAAARSELDALNLKRRTLLLDDASDTDLDRIEREIDRATIRLEKCTLAEQPLRERLGEAQADARRKRWKSLRESGLVAAAEFSASARATAAAHEKYIQVRETAAREGFAVEALTLPPTPNISGSALLAPDLLDLFDRACSTPVSENAQPQIKVAAKTSRRAPAPADAMTPHSVRLGSSAPIAKAARVADDLSELGAGEARVRTLRAGFSPADDRPAAARDQIVRMSAAAARAAAAAGAVEVLEARHD